MEISLCDEKGIPVVAWSIARALPVKLSAPIFDAATNQSSIDTLEIRAAGISVKHLV
jgi:phage tail-like protein